MKKKNYKSMKIKESIHDSGKCWKTTKYFMNWNSGTDPPSTLEVGGKLIRKASDIAALMNEFFIDKVQVIRNGIVDTPNNFFKCYE